MPGCLTMTATLLLSALLEQAALLRLVALPGGGRALEGPASAVAGGGVGSGERAGGGGSREGRLSVWKKEIVCMLNTSEI